MRATLTSSTRCDRLVVRNAPAGSTCRTVLGRDHGEAGAISLSRLVGDSEALIASLDGELDAERVDELQSASWPLELVNATAIDQGHTELSPRQRQDVEDACRELRRLLAA